MNDARWQSYPRPQLRRDAYWNLNGEWELNNHKIRVPFAPQSALSGYEGEIGEVLEYKKKFDIPKDFSKSRVILHFGAADEVADVYVNDAYVGRHEGGYLHFSFDITDYVDRKRENILRVKVIDRLSHIYPYGKQSKKRGGMWYTPISGIWQTVWLENVPQKYIRQIRLTPSQTAIRIEIDGTTGGFLAEIEKDGEQVVYQKCTENTATITIPQPQLWDPDHPHLYDLRITAGKDVVESYFALRTIEIRETDGIRRICLNGKPIFMHGLLDQGYYPDGIFLPEDEEEYTRDILRVKELGFNMLRKHIKIEPEKFYFECDRKGMLVVQDMVNNGGYHYLLDTVLPTIGFKKRNDCKGRYQNETCKRVFEHHMKETIRDLYNHPCIIGYTIFNEGWGQFESDRMYDIAKELDPTRFYDTTSGWFAQSKSDVDSEHVYFRSKKLCVKQRPMFLSECGGFSYGVSGHMYQSDKTYGYGTCQSSKELTDRISDMYNKMVIGSIRDGLCGCVYTQVSDVEDEINGMYTYDRQVCKVEKEKMRQIAERIYKQIETL